MVSMVSISGTQAILLMGLAVAYRLLALAAVVYLFWQLRSLNHGLRKLHTDLEELRRDLERAGK